MDVAMVRRERLGVYNVCSRKIKGLRIALYIAGRAVTQWHVRNGDTVVRTSHYAYYERCPTKCLRWCGHRRQTNHCKIMRKALLM